MIKFENIRVAGFVEAIRGMRNPMRSWDRSDSLPFYDIFSIGENDWDLMMKLRNAGPAHRKYLRMIVVWIDITAPMYWWSEFDTYKVGTVANSESKMHTIHKRPFTIDDFSAEHLVWHEKEELEGYALLESIVKTLNSYRSLYLKETDPEKKKFYWWHLIQLLPCSYNQKRTVMLNYEVLCNIYHDRQNHKQDEWSIGFMEWIKSLPYSELITGKEDD